MKKSLKAGSGRGTIRFPSEIFPIEGFTSIHDEPCARIIVLQGDNNAVIVAMDLVMANTPMIDRIQQVTADICKVDKENVYVHLTHVITTPHNPMMMPPSARTENAEKKGELHERAVIRAIEEAANQAMADIRPVTFGCESGISCVNINRDVKTPFGWWIGEGGSEPVNQNMRVIKLADSEGNPLAFMISYALRTCAIDNSEMDKNTRKISSDVAGKACRLLEEQFGVPCLFLMSAASNLVPCKTALYDVVEADGSVKTIDKGVDYGLEIVDSLGEQMAQDAAVIIQKITNCTEPGQIITNHRAFEWQALGRMEKKPALQLDYPLEDRQQVVDVWTLVIGDYAFVCGRAEMNQPSEQELMKRSPYPHTFLVTMVNGGAKYMPDAEAYDNYTWEAQSAPVAKGAAEHFIDTAVQMLNEA